MKKKILVLLISIFFSLCVLYTGFGDWHDSFQTEITITTAKSFPEDIKFKDGDPQITITQQIDNTNTFNSDSSWRLISR